MCCVAAAAAAADAAIRHATTTIHVGRSVGLQLSRSLARPNVGRTLRSYNKTRAAVLPTSFIKRAGDERANESIASAAGAAAATDDVAVQ